jgi:hypothetical protein
MGKHPNLELPLRDGRSVHPAWDTPFDNESMKAGTGAYELTGGVYGSEVRKVTSSDPQVATGSAHWTTTGIGYDRGLYSCRRFEVVRRSDERFLLSALHVPRIRNSTGDWGTLEGVVRKFRVRGKVYVVTGPVLTMDIQTIGKKTRFRYETVL